MPVPFQPDLRPRRIALPDYPLVEANLQIRLPPRLQVLDLRDVVDPATSVGLKETTQSVLAGLTIGEANILRMRFGIDMNTDHTLEQVGKQFDVTRERIRQIEAKALRKLRHPTRADQLRCFLSED